MSSRMTVKDVAADVAELKALILQIAGQPAAPVAEPVAQPVAQPVAEPVAKPRKASKPKSPDQVRVTGLFNKGVAARKAFRKALAEQLGVEYGPKATVKVLIESADTAGYDWRPIADQLIG